MASGLLMLLDDIATVLDDMAILTKVAAKKTAGVLGDDLALNAQQVSGVHAHRELPVVWAVALGSVVNKAILIPIALILSAVAPWAITPLLIIGGFFLCFEGCEKLYHKFFVHDHEDEEANLIAQVDADLQAIEKEKIKGAIRTDFVLSAEIIVITLGTVATEPFVTRLLVLVAIGALMTVGVYGLVAAIVKLDDLGMKLVGDQAGVLSGKPTLTQRLGLLILASAPYLMKTLGIAGTIAMFLVGGGILVHKVEALHHLKEPLIESLAQIGSVGPALATVTSAAFDGAAGLVGGALCLVAYKAIRRFT